MYCFSKLYSLASIGRQVIGDWKLVIGLDKKLHELYEE